MRHALAIAGGKVQSVRLWSQQTKLLLTMLYGDDDGGSDDAYDHAQYLPKQNWREPWSLR
jgi:hypothetical protein